MKINKKIIALIASICAFLLLGAFFIITYRDINISEMVMDEVSWKYTVKSIFFSKTVSSEVIDYKHSHSTTVALNGDYDFSGIVSAGTVATAKSTGSPLKTAYVYWNVIEDEAE